MKRPGAPADPPADGSETTAWLVGLADPALWEEPSADLGARIAAAVLKDPNDEAES